MPSLGLGGDSARVAARRASGWPGREAAPGAQPLSRLRPRGNQSAPFGRGPRGRRTRRCGSRRPQRHRAAPGRSSPRTAPVRPFAGPAARPNSRPPRLPDGRPSRVADSAAPPSRRLACSPLTPFASNGPGLAGIEPARPACVCGLAAGRGPAAPDTRSL